MVQGEEADCRERPRHDRRDDGAMREIALEVGRAGTPGVVDEKHGREVGARGDEQCADRDRQRIEPARHGVAGLAADGHAAACDRAHDRSEEERGQHRGEPEHRSASARLEPRCASWWKANPEPRRTIPSAARLSGTYRVEMIGREGGREAGPERPRA